MVKVQFGIQQCCRQLFHAGNTICMRGLVALFSVHFSLSYHKVITTWPFMRSVPEWPCTTCVDESNHGYLIPIGLWPQGYCWHNLELKMLCQRSALISLLFPMCEWKFSEGGNSHVEILSWGKGIEWNGLTALRIRGTILGRDIILWGVVPLLTYVTLVKGSCYSLIWSAESIYTDQFRNVIKAKERLGDIVIISKKYYY